AAMSVERPSVCPLDCPDTCSLTVTVEDDRVVRIRGSHANPYTDGVLCAKVPQEYPAFVHGAGRLRTPLRRVGDRGEGRFEPITWSQALDLIHARFTAVIAAHGPGAIFPSTSRAPLAFLPAGSLDFRSFPSLGRGRSHRPPASGGFRPKPG